MQLPFDRRRNLNAFFETPMGMFDVPDAATLNPKIADVILAREKKDKGIGRSNKGGWHSDVDLLAWPELEFADLADTFRSAVTHMIAATSQKLRFNIDLRLTAWANVSRSGDFNTPHIHPQNHWSGVYYVLAPDFSEDRIKRAGNIEFQDPRGPVTMLKSPGQADSMSLTPRQGSILLFPSWLYHWVNPFSIDTMRISIAFNAQIRKFEAVD